MMSCENVKKLAIKYFEETFKVKPDFLGIGPGRVNLIGDHVDYNDGFVMPMALQFVTVVAGNLSDTDICTVKTFGSQLEEQDVVHFGIGNIEPGSPSWANYVKGVVAKFPIKTKPFNAIICTSVPIGAGLSSSAALEVATFSFLEAVNSQPNDAMSSSEKALLCQKAEHEFAGVPCGIMDQFIGFHGKAGHALLLDCQSNRTELVPLDDPSVTVLVTNSNVRHKLDGGEYAERREACELVLKILEKRSFRDISEKDLKNNRDKIIRSAGDEQRGQEFYRYAHHVVAEISRVLKASEVLRNKDYVRFGKYMVDSHESLRDFFKVSCPEIDELVEAALECDGVFGSRMTGGGFGGCTVSLVKSELCDQIIDHMRRKYSGTASFYIVKPSDGARCEVLSRN